MNPPQHTTEHAEHAFFTPQRFDLIHRQITNLTNPREARTKKNPEARKNPPYQTKITRATGREGGGTRGIRSPVDGGGHGHHRRHPIAPPLRHAAAGGRRCGVGRRERHEQRQRDLGDDSSPPRVLVHLDFC